MPYNRLYVSLVAAAVAAVLGHSGAAAAVDPGQASASPSAAVTDKAEGKRFAFSQRSVPVGPRSFFGQEWRCQISKGGVVFFSTGFSETQTRRVLATRAPGRASCFRERRFRFFGID